MNERIREFLLAENKSSAQLAEEIGVQPSGISHILSGRNNPSLDFVVKMLEKYQFLSTDWLLFGKGPMLKESMEQTLFDRNTEDNEKSFEISVKNSHGESASILTDYHKAQIANKSESSVDKHTRVVEKIVWFYSNNSFEEYFPAQ